MISFVLFGAAGLFCFSFSLLITVFDSFLLCLLSWCDAYVRVFVSKEEMQAGRDIKKTEVVKKAKDPVWNDFFEL
jgi:hypothetical protein